MPGARVRKLPTHVGIYLLIALCLYPDDDYEEVAKKLTGMLALMPGACWEAPTRGAITQAHQRLGSEVVREVFRQVARPAATESTPGAWLNRWRVMAVDGIVIDLPDTQANVIEFSHDSAGGYETAFPQARVVAISEFASHAIVAADVAVERGDAAHRRPRLLQLRGLEPGTSQRRSSAMARPGWAPPLLAM